MELKEGDYVGVNNVNFGLFGVGKITSGYKFKKGIHNTGSEDTNEFYSHYRTVDWVVKDYYSKEELIGEGDTLWQPFGTIGTLFEELPPYIKRLLGEPVQKSTPKITFVAPEYLKNLVKSINILKKDNQHQERAHESLVEDFFTLIGYEKHEDIRYRQGRVDITIYGDNRPLLLSEVKRDWNLNWRTHAGDLKQAYGYSLDKGIRFILLTNGDYYALFDRLKGLSYESNLIGEFQLSALNDSEALLIERLKKEALMKPNISEILKHISQSFE